MSSTYPQDLNWLVSDFIRRVPHTVHAAVVSADGLLLAQSERIPPAFADQFAAVICGLASLMQATAQILQTGSPTQALVEMDDGLMLIKIIGDGSSLAVLAAPQCDTDLVSYEVTLLVEAVGEALTPATRAPRGS